MQRRLITHRKLSYISRMIRKLGIKFILGPAQPFAKRSIQITDKLIRSPHQLHQITGIMLDIPAINPRIVLPIIFAGTHTTGKTVIKRFDKIAVFIFGMEKGGLRMK